MSASLDQLPMSASSTIVAAATSDRASAMFWAIARRKPRKGSAGPDSARTRATRSTSADVITPSAPDGVTMARSTPSLRAKALTAGMARTPAPACSRELGASRITCVPVATAPTMEPAPSSSSPAPSNPTSGDPIWTISPTLANSRSMRAACGEGISTTAFAVSTASKGSSTATVWPDCTRHSTTSASCKPSPRSGSRKIFITPP